MKTKRKTPSGAVGSQGITVFDNGDYFTVRSEGDGGGATTYPKSYNGFRTAGELLGWLLNPMRTGE